MVYGLCGGPQIRYSSPHVSLLFWSLLLLWCFLLVPYCSLVMIWHFIVARGRPDAYLKPELACNRLRKVTFFSQFLKFLELQETRGTHVTPYRACISDISKALKCAAFAQRESFDNVQVRQRRGQLLFSVGGLWVQNGRSGEPYA